MMVEPAKAPVTPDNKHVVTERKTYARSRKLSFSQFEPVIPPTKAGPMSREEQDYFLSSEALFGKKSSMAPPVLREAKSLNETA